MGNPDIRIIEFIRKHHVLTLATSSDEQPWCANCFYAFMEDEVALIFTSDEETRHICEAGKNTKVAGSIVLETEIIGKIQGIQFAGKIFKAESEARYKKRYLQRFPYAILTNSPLWAVELDYIKFTDNLLGFGKKLIWSRESDITK
jgi:hypothetical protein